MQPHPESQFLDARAVLVEARFRGRLVGARLLGARTTRPFTIGAARRADAPVDPSFLPADAPANDNHALVSRSGRGFVVHLSPVMRARLDPSPGRLRVPCGEVVFDISAAEDAPAWRRPWLARGLREEAPYTLGVAAGLLVLLGILAAVPSDPHAISLDDVGRTVRLDSFKVVPPALVAQRPEGGPARVVPASAPVAPRAPRESPSSSARGGLPRRGAQPPTRASLPETIRRSTLLALLDGPRAPFFALVAAEPKALGASADEVLAHLEAVSLERAYAADGLAPTGTGAGAADTGHALIGGPGPLPTLGRAGGGPSGPSYGRDAGPWRHLPPHKVVAIQAVSGPLTTRGSLDKEIVRRVVRTHLNEVRFCYEEALLRQPSLAGRVVVQFTIAPTGRVLVSALQSSTLASPAVEQCVVAATRRWTYPRPDGGGLVDVTYPFQLVPAS
jgi:TonB family protein